MKTWHLFAIGAGALALFVIASPKVAGASPPPQPQPPPPPPSPLPIPPAPRRKTPDDIVAGDRFSVRAIGIFQALENPSFVEAIGLSVLARHEETGGESVIPITMIDEVL
jgi:hypothetical protein